jgi:hypothetical protein
MIAFARTVATLGILVAMASQPAWAKDSFAKMNLLPEVLGVEAAAAAATVVAGPPVVTSRFSPGDGSSPAREDGGRNNGVDIGCVVAGPSAVVKGMMASAPVGTVAPPEKMFRVVGPEAASAPGTATATWDQADGSGEGTETNGLACDRKNLWRNKD